MKDFRWLALVPATVLLFTGEARARGNRDAQALAAMAALASGKTGTVCWQSRRAGPLKIFCCDLDGENLRQISPDVAGRDQLGPLISPDGTRVLYYQSNVPLSGSSYYNDHTGDMMMVDADDTDGSSAQVLVEDVRTYFECRFARWLDNDRIAYIASNHHTFEYTLSQGTSAKLFDYPLDDFGAIPNRQLTHAVDGKNRVFTVNNPGASGTLTEEQDYDGCEGNMSWDGLWAYRVKGGWPGHDFYRMHLGDWHEEMFFENLNDALPADQKYIYFPQVSLCQRYLSLGVSRDRDEHDHWASDYDIFVAPIDPVSFQMTGDPVKYSFANELDAYPDIWVASNQPPALLLAPATLDFQVVAGSPDPASRAVNVSNAGGGTLDVVQCTEAAGWLTVLASGSGNAQTLGNQVAVAGLSVGTYTETVQVAAANAANTPQSYTVNLEVVEAPSVPIRINCGDNQFDVAGWTQDDAFVTGGNDWVNQNDVDTAGVPDAAPPDVYRSVRHQSPHGYTIALPDGDYLFRMHFADAMTDRSMTFTVEGVVVLEDFDIATEAGGINRALVKDFAVTVTGGDGLQIEATSDGDVFECGLEILAAQQEESRPDAGSDAGADPGPDDAGTDADAVSDSAGQDPGAPGDEEVDIVGACGCGGVYRPGFRGAAPGPDGTGWILLLLLATWWSRKGDTR